MTDHDLDPALDPELDHVSRRRFLERMSISTFAAAVLGKEALPQVNSSTALDDKNLVQEDVTFPSDDKRVEAFLCQPKTSGKRGSIIVIQEIFGLNDHVRDIACRLAKAGFNGLAVNFFTREGKPPEGFGPPLMDFVNKIPDSQVIGDIKAAASYLRSRPDSNGKVGTLGYCWGGRIAMLADASIPDLNASVAYYGRIRQAAKTDNQPNGPIDVIDKMTAPLLGHFGANDRGIPPADAGALKEELKKLGKTAEIYEYEGAGHAFNNDTRESYHPESAKLAWHRTLEWFDMYLKHA